MEFVYYYVKCILKSIRNAGHNHVLFKIYLLFLYIPNVRVLYLFDNKI